MNSKNWSVVSSLAALLVGVILLWSLGKNWLNFNSALTFLAGLLGVSVPVLIFGIWKIYHPSDKDDA
jgi:hypothetical protein